MIYCVTAFLSTVFLCLILIKLKKYFVDTHEGVQRFHSWQASRIGGLGVFISFFIVYFLFLATKEDFSNRFLFVIISCIPVFLAGLIEDLTKK